MRQNTPSKGSKSYCCFNETVPIWPYNIIQGTISNLVSEYHKLFTWASSPPALPNWHGHKRACNSEADNLGNSKVRVLCPGSQDFFLLSAKKRAACKFTGIPLHTKWLKISLPPSPCPNSATLSLYPPAMQGGFVSSLNVLWIFLYY